MAQVPQHNDLIIGGGKMARHWGFYLQSLGTPATFWNRSNSVKTKPRELSAYFNNFSTVYLAISDDALKEFYETYLTEFSGSVFHFSGAFYHPEIAGIHPLMTFGKDLYPADFYKSIPLTLDFSSKNSFIASLPNPQYTVSPKDKALYHSFCVIAGNFPQWLWQNVFTEFEKLNIPKAALQPFLQQSLDNTFKTGDENFSGPLLRNDQITLARHQEALDGHHLLQIYSAFVEAVKKNSLPASPTSQEFQ